VSDPGTDERTFSDSIHIAASPDAVYDLVSDITRTGEWSPVCRACEWEDDPGAPRVGARFVGHNEMPGRAWDTTSTVVAAERGREFAWQVGESYVQWGYTMHAEDGGTRLTESWHFRPEGVAMFRERYGADAQAHIEQRTTAAHEGIPATLAALKRIGEAGSG
jgi:ribosome-associated toxin RatA of RatAB toxin-antitoxin module